LYQKLKPLARPTSPFRVKPKTNTPVTWVEPELVCQVQFQEWTADGSMRHPLFLGLRTDKAARRVRRELPKAVPQPSAARVGTKGRGGES
jgi:bifunctional non-homologous end joining protein LigD